VAGSSTWMLLHWRINLLSLGEFDVASLGDADPASFAELDSSAARIGLDPTTL
jgi:hypothetical protein